MVKVKLISEGNDSLPVSYVAIAARHEDGWIFVRHRRRGGFEMPAGHPCEGEDTVTAAMRELAEETGATDFTMEPVAYYSVDAGQGEQYGRLFYAEVEKLGELTDHDEIEGIRIFRRMPRNLSLREVMSFLFRVARQHGVSLKV